MKKLTKREKIMIGAAVSAVVFMCFYMFVYQPKKKEVLRLQEELRTVDLEIERIVQAIPGLRKLEEEVSQEQKGVSLAKKTTFGEQQMQQLLRQLAREAYKLDMNVISLGSGEESESPHEKSRYKKLTMVMNIRCPYRHLGLYLKELSNLPGLVTVDGLEILRDKQIFPKVQVKLTLSTFLKK